MKNVWVNGCFDILHIGHIRLLEYASTFGRVRVGIDSDKRVSRLKGENRPFNNESIRKEVLESIKYVSDVVIFNTDTELINNIIENKTEIMVIGEEYKDKIIIGYEYCPKIHFFERVGDHSTTKILGNEGRSNW